MNKKIVSVIFLILIAVLAAGEFILEKKTFSPMENRYLADMPEADWQSIRSGEWMDGLEDYMADHIPLRDAWMQLKNSLERLVGREQIGSVCFAPDDRLIQVQNVTLDQLQTNATALGNWVDGLPENVKTYFLVAPTASWIYEDQLPPFTLTYNPQQAYEQFLQAMPERLQCVNPYDELMEHREEPIYFKSDHHWTMQGAAYAFEQLAEVMRLQENPFEYERAPMGYDFKGSVYSQAPTYGYPGEAVEVWETPGLYATWEADENKKGTVLMSERFSEKDQYTAFMGGNYGLTRITNEKATNPERILVLKDSYANIMMPFLAAEYQEIVMVDLRYFRGNLNELMETERIETLLCIYNLDFLCTDQNFVWLDLAGRKDEGK